MFLQIAYGTVEKKILIVKIKWNMLLLKYVTEFLYQLKIHFAFLVGIV